MSKPVVINYDKTHFSKLDRNIYILYLFTMPMGRLVYRPEGIFTTLEIMGFSSFVMLIGSLLLLRHRNLSLPKRLHCFLTLYAFMVVYSIVVAIMIHSKIPSYHGVSTLFLPIENIINYFLTLVSLYYNYTCLSSIKNFKSLSKIFDASIYVCLFVGLLQMGILNDIPGCRSLYDVLKFFFNLYDPDTLTHMERGVTIFGSEPSSMANMFYVTIPYLIVSIIYKWPRRKSHMIMLAIFCVLFFGSGSSSVIIFLILSIACTLVLLLKKTFLRYVTLGAFCVGAMTAVLYATAEFQEQSMDQDSLEYRLYGKAIDRDNKSTQMRSSTIAVNMKLIAEYPITVVGMGMQGLWYNDMVPNWTKKSHEVQNLLKAKDGISNGGGNFFPFYLSSFGVIGLIVLFNFLSKYFRYVKRLSVDTTMYSFFLIGISMVLLSMWYTSSPKNNEYICFLLAFPLAFYPRNNANSNQVLAY